MMNDDGHTFAQKEYIIEYQCIASEDASDNWKTITAENLGEAWAKARAILPTDEYNITEVEENHQ